MRPTPASEAVQRAMKTQATRDTGPEVALRKLLFAAGLRYRINFRVPQAPRRTIDVAFPKWKVAVFVDGCFWHGCPEHCVPPKNNALWWAKKLDANRNRDAGTNALLRAQGWRVLRLWEHLEPNEMADRVATALQENRLSDR